MDVLYVILGLLVYIVVCVLLYYKSESDDKRFLNKWKWLNGMIDEHGMEYVIYSKGAAITLSSTLYASTLYDMVEQINIDDKLSRLLRPVKIENKYGEGKEEGKNGKK